MPRLNPALPGALRALEPYVDDQAGTCTAAQARAAGLSGEAVVRLLRSGRWQRLHRGVYVAYPEVPSLETRMWGAHLALGEGSVIAGRAAGHAWGLLPGVLRPHETVDVLVPEGLRLHAHGVTVRRVPFPEAWAHPARRPPVLTIEHTVLDLVRLASGDEEATELILRACRLRLTRPERILGALATRSRVRRRGLVRDVCADAGVGVMSTLERRYRKDVGTRHGLPVPVAQQQGSTWGGATVYRDLRYDPFNVIVELDGRLGHEDESAVFRDQFRDNAATLTGAATLRFGWLAVVGHTCQVALQVGHLLASRGWNGTLRPCSADCPVDRTRSRAA